MIEAARGEGEGGLAGRSDRLKRDPHTADSRDPGSGPKDGGTAVQLFRLVKFEHSVFALPFVLAGAFLAAGGVPSAWSLAWIVAAAVGARNFAFALNRLADKDFDAKNPRTRDRLAFRYIVEGKGIWVFMAVSLALFLVSAGLLNRLTLWLSPVVVGIIVFYSYAKRWTWSCHLFLGSVHGCAAAGAWIAVRGDLTAVPLWLALGATTWVAGFDLIYACLDFDFDRAEGLRSVPARFGVPRALWLSGGLHFVTVLSLFMAGWSGQLGAIYWLSWLLGTVLLGYEHVVVRPSDFSRVDLSFFQLNAWFSVIVGMGAVADVLWRSYG